MPQRTPADRAAILASYAETQNAKETARRLGLHYNTVNGALRRNRGKCTRCAQPASPGRYTCASCAKHIREEMKRKRRERRAAGLCVCCDLPRLPRCGFCEAHRKVDAKHRAAYHCRQRAEALRKRGCHSQTIPTAAERRETVRYNYGAAGIEAWERDGAACQICGVTLQGRSVHLHHIDGDPSHNTAENFACLCFECHQLVHRFTEHPSPPVVLAWVRTHRPDLAI